MKEIKERLKEGGGKDRIYERNDGKENVREGRREGGRGKKWRHEIERKKDGEEVGEREL